MPEKDKVILAADHAGFELKGKVKDYLLKSDVEIEDLSEKFTEGDDYPDICFKAAKKVVKEGVLGIFLCGNGLGMCICANKVKGIRAIVGSDENIARQGRQHNDSNVLCLGGRTLDEKKAVSIVRAWISSGFLEGRHKRRVEKIKQYESN
jgi:ribose 5-phosphate isomerase B